MEESLEIAQADLTSVFKSNLIAEENKQKMDPRVGVTNQIIL